MKQAPLTSGIQRSLQQPLANFFLSSLSGEPGKSIAGRIFEESLLGPALRGFETRTRPGIESTFASYGGSLSSRRPKVLGEAYSDIQTSAQGQLASLLPSIVFDPIRMANQFALQPTNQPFVQQSPSPFSQLVGGAGLFTSIFGAPFGSPTTSGFDPGTGLFAKGSRETSPPSGDGFDLYPYR